MINPADSAKEYKRLWQDNPLGSDEIEAIQRAIAALDALTEDVFVEDALLISARIFLAHFVEDPEEGDSE